MLNIGYFFRYLDHLFETQSFDWFDTLILAVVILIEILLSADNMLIIALLIKKLNRFQRASAIWIGLMGSVVLRIVAIIMASYLIRFYYFQGIGGAYLMYLAGQELLYHKSPITEPPKTHSLSQIILYIIFLDLLFSVDSILAAFAIVGISPLEGDTSPKLWIVIVGASFGIILLRSFTSNVIRWLEEKPILEKFTLIFVIWIGFRLVVESVLSSLQLDFGFDMNMTRELVKWIFWAITLVFFIYAFGEILKDKKKV
jgi:YkoY family integral membrane protein